MSGKADVRPEKRANFEIAIRGKKRIAQDVQHEGIVLFGEERYYHLLSRLVLPNVSEVAKNRVKRM